MKKVLLAFCMLLGVLSYAQTPFDRFEKDDKVNSVVVNKKMFDLMAKVKVDANDAETKNYLALIKKLDHLKLFTSKDQTSAKALNAAAESYLKQGTLEELMRSADNGKNVKIYVKSTGVNDIITELLMLVEDQNSSSNVSVMSLTGNFALSELSVLTQKMKLPGSDAINKASKK